MTADADPTDLDTAGDNDVACAVCAEPLSRVQDAGGQTVGWLHRGEAPGGKGIDHVGVPVLRQQVSVEARCDFCSGPRPGWELPTEKFVSDDGLGTSANFSCCEVCAKLIRKERWDDLAKRAAASSAAQHGVSCAPELVEHTRRFLAQVREHVTGPVQRAGP